MARENRLWEWLHDGLKGVEGLHLVRVENLVSTGDPDVEGCWQGSYFEVELKGANRPVRGGKLDWEVRRSQVLYHRKRTRCGGNTWLYARVGIDRDVRRYLVPGERVAALGYDCWNSMTEQFLSTLAVLPPVHSQLDMLERVRERWVKIPS